MKIVSLLLFLTSFNLLASVTIPWKNLNFKTRNQLEDIQLTEKNFWHANKIFSRLGDFGIELNENGRCRYLTRKNLLKKGSQADWDCFFAFRNVIRDINYCAPENWDDLPDEENSIHGLFRYVGVAPLPYKYDLIPHAGKVVAKSTIYYKGYENLNDDEKKLLTEKLKKATNLWNENTPAEFPYEILVERTEKKEDAHFIINLVRGWTRGPYLKEHSLDWNHRVFAHEFGHMLGLDDEYDQIIGTLFGRSRCTNDSLMCSHYKLGFPRYYWYIIFRRGQCA